MVRPSNETNPLAPSSCWLQKVADPVRLAVVRRLTEVERATARELSEGSFVSPATMRRHLGAMVADGLLREHPGVSDGEGSGRPPLSFSLPEQLRESVRAVLVIDR
jgi:predicted ArsR family transcriptional regulator